MSYGLYRLGREELIQVRSAAIEEVVTGVRAGAPMTTLRQLADVVAEAEARLDRTGPRERLENRSRIAAEKRPSWDKGRVENTHSRRSPG